MMGASWIMGLAQLGVHVSFAEEYFHIYSYVKKKNTISAHLSP